MNNSNNLNYDQIFKNIIQISGNDLSRFEQYALLIHAIFLRLNFIYKDNKILESDWNREYDKAEFEYLINEVAVKLEMSKDPNDGDKIMINITASSQENNNGNLSMSSTINLNDQMVTKIDFAYLDGTIQDLEKFIRETFFKEILKTGENRRNHNNSGNYGVNTNVNLSRNNYPYDLSGGEVDPNRLLNTRVGQGGYNPIPNPYFSTGGGSAGGMYVGPNSDIFVGNMFPQPQPGMHQPIRYDPIGPFGTFGGPSPKKKDVKKTDPMFGGNPFMGDFPGSNNKKGPFGGSGGFGGGFGRNPWG